MNQSLRPISHPSPLALSPLPNGSGANIGELRLQSDLAFSRDPRTACTFQSFVNNQAAMTAAFKSSMEKLALVGQNTKNMIDCSEAVPAAAAAVTKPATLPAGKTMKDIQGACAATPFPTLATDRE